MAKWFLDSIDVAGGFLAGLSLRLPRGLICVIGPRGSGKSTLAEAIRYGIAGANNASKPRQDLIRANLAPAVITIRTIDAEGNPAYTIKRAGSQPPVLLGSDGRSISSVDLDRGTFLPLDAYTSLEIEDIARESMGDRRRALLDELRSEELEQIRLAVAQHRRDLEANADAIRTARRLIADHTERIEELGDARAKLAALPPLPGGGKPDRFLTVSKQRQATEREIANLKQALVSIAVYQRELAAANTKLRDSFARPHGTLESPNELLLAPIYRAVEGIWPVIEASDVTVGEQIANVKTPIESALLRLEEIRAAHNEEYAQLQAEDQAAGQAVRERSQLQQSVTQLESLEKERTGVQAELQHLLDVRKRLKGAYLLERDRVSDLREAVAQTLQQEAGKKVRVRVMRNADSLSYKQTLLEGLQGARVRNHEDVLRSLMRLRPEELAQIIQDGDGDELERQTKLGRDRSDRILETFRQAIDPLALEVVDIEDRVCIELNVSNTSEANFRDAAELSRGQMCTALLPQLLARRTTPLVIDQPEDNLDNHFIYETIVETVRRLKAKRQMIFITHNANIPVLAEAELVIVLNSDGKTGSVQKAGTLDQCRDEIVDLLEGGDLAFEMRGKRYAK